MKTEKQITDYNLPIIVIVGRANVGKSTLFNKLIEEQKALVSKIAGTTRTNNEGLVLWRGKYIKVIDTGGLDEDENNDFLTDINNQVKTALDQANLIIFLIDAKTGILPQEKELSKQITKNNKKNIPVLLVANKVDNNKIEQNLNTNDIFKLHLGQAFPISAANGRNIGDLLDVIFKQINKQKKRPKSKINSDKTINISLIGKPNVGKSSLFNKIIGQDKVIVSSKAHTTREPFDTNITFQKDKKKYFLNFIDTAGIRRKAKVKGLLEKEGIKKSIKTIEKSDIILLILDGSEPISSQDMQLGGLIKKRSKSVIIIINKWDLSEDKSDKYRNQVKKMVYSYFPHLDFAPILFVSGKTGLKVQQILPLILQINNARQTEIPTQVLDKFLDNITKQHKPARGKGTRHPKLLRFKQINSNPPIFELTIKNKTSLHRSYLNYIEHKLREQFNFLGTPIVIKLTKQKR